MLDATTAPAPSSMRVASWSLAGCGKLAIFDVNTKKPRLIVDIEAGAKLTVKENRTQSPLIAKWEPFDRACLDRRVRRDPRTTCR
jgi:hypothetical protein